MPSRSDGPGTPQARRRRSSTLLLIVLVLVLVLVPAGAVLADIINTGRYVVAEDDVQDEDVYVAATSGRVDGRIEGDLVIATESLLISGTVTGDVLVAARGTVRVDGTIEGSLRGVARRIEVTGAVGDDVAVAAVSMDLDGDVGRDVIGLGASAAIDGTVGRDVRGRFRSIDVGGDVGRDVDVTGTNITLEPAAMVQGDVVYQAVDDVAVAEGAEVAGQIIKIPTDVPFFVGLVFNVVGVLGFLGYLLGGIILLWLMRMTGPQAVAAITLRPGRSLAVGAAAMLLGPVAVVVMAASLVAIPLALIVLGVMAAGLMFGSVPLVSAVGTRLLVGRGGIYGGFLFGAVLGRVLAALWAPLGIAIFGVALMWGIGGWLLGAWKTRTTLPMPRQSVSENSR